MSKSPPQVHILVLADSYLPHAGGSRVYYHSLYKHFPSEEITVLTKEVPGWREFDKLQDYTIIRRGKPLASWNLAELPKGMFPFFSAMNFSLSHKVDIIHAGDLYPPGLIAALLRFTSRIPFIAFSHGEDITLTQEYRYQPKVRNYIYRRADAVIANAEFSRQGLLKNGIPERRIHKITPAVDSHRFCPQAPRPDLVRRFNLSGKFTVLTVARLVPRKGHDRVLHALAQLAREVNNLKYLIVGRGPEQQRLQSTAQELGVSNLVEFVGYVADEELPDFYNLCDVMVMPNQEEHGDLEGFGMVFLEANAAGKAVIGSRSGGASEAIQDGVTGLLIEDPKDSQQLYSALKRLQGNAELRIAMGAAGERRARSEFSWQRRAEQLREITLDIVRSRRSASETE